MFGSRNFLAAAGVLSLIVSSCDDAELLQPPVTQDLLQYERVDLVSDIPGRAKVTDPHLINPWGLAFGPDSFFWIANAGSGTLTVYDAEGTPSPSGSPLIISASSEDAEVTGMAFNPTDEFQIETTPGVPLTEAPATFLVATAEGVIEGFNPMLGTRTAIAVEPEVDGEAYLGMALATDPERGPLLYLANFGLGEVEVYDGDFEQVALDEGSFEDVASPAIPSSYAPFAVHAIDDQIWVTYAERDPGTMEEVRGAGKGFVSVFETSGRFIRRFASQGELDAPWGIAHAPSDFGRLHDTILIGNFGDGRINAYNTDTGEFVDALLDANKTPIAIEGLWAISFGNGAMAGATNELYFTAGIDGEMHGAFGRIRPLTAR
jgi:uncharacterized protein (TIGR03118 family)